MLSSSILAILCIVLVSHSRAAPVQEDIFSGFLKDINLNAPPKESDVVKRTAYDENPDSSLKQISLRALIGDLERSFYQSAMSVSNVANDNSAIVPEITPASSEHRATKRHTEENTATEQLSRFYDPQAATENPRIVLQTTEKVPRRGSYPGHVLIDRISVQPYFSGLPIIPAFQVQHSKLIPEGSNATTQISISKKVLATATASASQLDNAQGLSTSTIANKQTTAATHEENIAATSTTATTATTPNLKKAEADLKEKVAEIEADPVILSARI